MKNKGFTLIELLAVITIMGILMLVAIPAVSRTIENSRRDSYANVMHEYVNAVRNAILADNLDCTDSGNNGTYLASAAPAGKYAFPICTVGTTCADITLGPSTKTKKFATTNIAQSTADLLESGGKSPYGSADVRGYVLINKSISTTGTTKYAYSILLLDTGLHGISTETRENEIKRAKIVTAPANTTLMNWKSGYGVCMMN